MAAKAEGVAQCNFDVALLGLVEGHVQPGVKIRIIVEVVDRRGYDRLVDCKQTSDGFYGAGSTQQMSDTCRMCSCPPFITA